MCEGTASDDPFASFSTQNSDNRLKLTAEVDREKFMLQATLDGCLWEEDSNDSSILPKLKDPSLFKQNPNNTSQFIYTLSNDENLLLDFNNYQCLLQKSNGTKQQITCYDTSKVVADKITAPQTKSSTKAQTAASAENPFDKYNGNVPKMQCIMGKKNTDVTVTILGEQGEDYVTVMEGGLVPLAVCKIGGEGDVGCITNENSQQYIIKNNGTEFFIDFENVKMSGSLYGIPINSVCF